MYTQEQVVGGLATECLGTGGGDRGLGHADRGLGSWGQGEKAGQLGTRGGWGVGSGEWGAEDRGTGDWDKDRGVSFRLYTIAMVTVLHRMHSYHVHCQYQPAGVLPRRPLPCQPRILSDEHHFDSSPMIPL